MRDAHVRNGHVRGDQLLRPQVHGTCLYTVRVHRVPLSLRLYLPLHYACLSLLTPPAHFCTDLDSCLRSKPATMSLAGSGGSSTRAPPCAACVLCCNQQSGVELSSGGTSSTCTQGNLVSECRVHRPHVTVTLAHSGHHVMQSLDFQSFKWRLRA